MEMDPPPMHLVPSPFATQSGTCAILKGGGGELYVMPLSCCSDVRAGDGFEL